MNPRISIGSRQHLFRQRIRKQRPQKRHGRCRSRPLPLEALEDRRVLSAGDLDVGFGFLGPPPFGPPSNGVVISDFPGGFANEQGRSVAIQADGKIVVAGLESDVFFGEAAENGDIVLARYHGRDVVDQNGIVSYRPGDLDFTFGSDVIGFSTEEGLAIRDVPGGDAAGSGSSNFTLFGATFTGGEVTQTGTPGMHASLPASYVFGAEGGSITFATPVSGIEFFFVDDTVNASFTATAYDTAEVTAGTAPLATVTSHVPTTLAAESNFVSFDDSLRISRIDFSGGAIDDFRFADGRVRTDIGGTGDGAFAVDVQSDGRIVIAGFAATDTGRDFAVASYHGLTIADAGGNILFRPGDLDPSFHGGGITTVDFGDGDDIAFGLDIQPDGKIVVGGPVANDAFEFLDLGVLGGGDRAGSEGYGVNEFGVLAGVSTKNGPGRNSFRTGPDSPIDPATSDLGTLGGDGSFGRGVNDLGQVVGFSELISGNRDLQHGFIAQPGSPIDPASSDLGTLGGDFSIGFAINNAGQVAGHSSLIAGTGTALPQHAYLITPDDSDGDGTADRWHRDDDGDTANDLMVDLGTLGGNLSESHGINDLGQVVGFSLLPGDTFRRAFLWSNDTLIDLGTLGGSNSQANGINEQGQIAGASDITGDAETHAFLITPLDTNGDGAPDIWNKDVDGDGVNDLMQDLGVLPGNTIAVANDINESGWVVGFSGVDVVDDPDRHAFLFNGSEMVDLNDVVPAGTGAIIREALSLNDIGQIAGFTCDPGGAPCGTREATHKAFLLTPEGSDFGVARLNPDGSLDETFDGDGRATAHFGFGDDTIRNVTLQPDGKILASGLASTPIRSPLRTATTDMALARFNADGSLDSSFDGDGRTQVDFGFHGDEAGQAIALQADGRIIVVGPAFKGNPAPPDQFDWGIARFDPDGSLDDTWDEDGLLQTDFGGADDVALSVAVQQDGRILVAGLAGKPNPGGPPNGDIGLARYLSNGQLDPTFGLGGKVTTDTFGQFNEAFDIAIDRDGKIVAVGFVPTGFDMATMMPINDFAVVRYQNDPVTLMTGGISQFPFPLSADPTRRSGHPAGMTVGPDGNIWTTDPFAGRIAKFDMAKQKVEEFDFPQPPFSFVGPHAITVGPDSNLWFTAFTPPIEGVPHIDQMGKFDPLTERFTIYDIYSPFTQPGCSRPAILTSQSQLPTVLPTCISPKWEPLSTVTKRCPDDWRGFM